MIEITKIKVTPEMIGQDVYILSKDKKMKYGEPYHCEIKPIADSRSYRQLKLYFGCCDFVSQNTDDQNWNTKDKTSEQCKIHCRLFDHWIYYENQKTGEKTLNIKTGSIDFKNLKHLDACGYFDQAFDYMADKIGMTKEELFAAYEFYRKNGLESIGEKTEFKQEIYPASEI